MPGPDAPVHPDEPWEADEEEDEWAEDEQPFDNDEEEQAQDEAAGDDIEPNLALVDALIGQMNILREFMPAHEYVRLFNIGVVPPMVRNALIALGYHDIPDGLDLILGNRLDEIAPIAGHQRARRNVAAPSSSRLSLPDVEAFKNRAVIPHARGNMSRDGVLQMYNNMRIAFGQVREERDAALARAGRVQGEIRAEYYPHLTDDVAEEDREGNAHHAYLMDAFYQTQHTPWPRPFDWNWTYKVLNIWPVQILPSIDYATITNVPLPHMMQLAHLVFALYRSMTTTVLYANNLTGIN